MNLRRGRVHQSGGSSSDMVFGAELVAIVKVQQVPGVSDAPKLFSSDAPGEGYVEAAGVTVDEANKKITIPSPSSNKFFRINGPTAVTITRIQLVGNNIEISYQ